MSREEPQINVRVSEELKAKIKSRAMNNRRSMNAEIVHILQEAVNESPRGIDDLAKQEADKFKEALLETLKGMYGKEKK
ncbi:Arc family DNA-binding protein [Scandinavium manionii]|uniref:Arc family DNA-binding protein n=1 Tax=Scandinavium manionii TaxID=2926520 RepID=UPI00216696BB|nr:Arc family DNA-binding protein [Scandinavium manionii]MCS2167538.1 Arc family DNA-binding protein [Scandinavium manionii]